MLKFHRSNAIYKILLSTIIHEKMIYVLFAHHQRFMPFSTHKTNFLFQIIIDGVQLKPVRSKHIKSNIFLIQIIVIVKKKKINYNKFPNRPCECSFNFTHIRDPSSHNRRVETTRTPWTEREKRFFFNRRRRQKDDPSDGNNGDVSTVVDRQTTTMLVRTKCCGSEKIIKRVATTAPK